MKVKCFKWLHTYKNHKYDEMFDFKTKTFYLSEYNIETNGTIFDHFLKLKYYDEEKIQFNISNKEEEDFDIRGYNKSKSYLLNNIVVKQDTLFNKRCFKIESNKAAFLISKFYSLQDENVIFCFYFQERTFCYQFHQVRQVFN